MSTHQANGTATATTLHENNKTSASAAIKPVTALACISGPRGQPALLLSAQGFHLRIHHAYAYASGGPLLTTPIFAKQIIHGITVCDAPPPCRTTTSITRSSSALASNAVSTADSSSGSTELLIWGGRSVRRARARLLAEDAASAHGQLLFEVTSDVLECTDWLLDVCGPRAGRPAVGVTAHNELLAFQGLHDADSASGTGTTGRLRVTLLGRGPRSILYAAHVVWRADGLLLLACGTAFGQILVQTCELSCAAGGVAEAVLRTHAVFGGHEGSVFGVRLSETLRLGPAAGGNGDAGKEEMQLLASCSDDRSVRVWDVSDLSTVIDTSAVETGESGFLAVETETCLASAVGHLSRVWSLRYMDAADDSSLVRLVSAGEDATCRVWDLRRDSGSKLILNAAGTVCEHSGKNVWAMEVVGTAQSGGQVVVSGGADGSIVMSSLSNSTESASFCDSWSLEDVLSASVAQEIKPKDCFRAIALVSDGAVLAVSDDGHVMLSHPIGTASLDDNTGIYLLSAWTRIDILPDLRGYSVGASTTAGNFAVLAGASGAIHIFDSRLQSLRPLHQCQRKVSGLWVEHDPQDPRQNLTLLAAELGSDRLTMVEAGLKSDGSAEAQQITSIEIGRRVVTTAVSYHASSGTWVAVGFRSGGISVSRQDQSVDSSTRLMSQLDIANAGKESITQLRFSTHNNQLFLSAVGRDGYHSMWKLSPDTLNAIQIHRLSLPFGPHVEGLWLCPLTQDLVVYGFRSTRLIVYNLNEHREIASIDCGGAHRTFAVQIESQRSDDGTVVKSCTFAWTQLRQLRRRKVWDSATRVLQAGGHGRDIKACAVSPAQSDEPTLIATGAEDTDIRLFRQDHAQFKCMALIRKHITGIRCLKWSQDGTRHFSSGGKEEFFVWRITPAPVVHVGVVCEAVLPVQDGGSDLRIMSFDIRNSSKDQVEFIVTLAFSNSLIKTYRYAPEESVQWQLLASSSYTNACLTHLEYLETDSLPLSFATTSTDGSLVLWDMSDAANSHQHRLQTFRQLHQSSITACALRKTRQDTWLIVTGGDDNALSFSILRRNVQTIDALRIPRAHGAAITGIQLTPDHDAIAVTSVGLDQRVKHWEYDGQSHTVHKVSSKWTSISDPAGVNTVIFGVGLARP